MAAVMAAMAMVMPPVHATASDTRLLATTTGRTGVS
jgi:hypothetical protein